MATITVKVDSSQAEASLKGLKTSMKSVDSSATTLAKTSGNAFKGLAATVVGIAAGSTLIASSFIDINRELERQAILLTSVTGSVDAGAVAFNDLLTLATQAPFSLDALSDSFTRLKVSGMEPMDGTLKSITDAVAAFGGTSDDLKFATLAIQQMSAKGVVSMEELRRQLAERIPSAVQDMAKGLGLTYDELVSKVSSGQQNSSEAIEAMLSVFDTKYAGSGEKLMSSFDGAIRGMGIQRDKLFKEFADEGIWDSLIESIRDVTEVMDDVSIDPQFKEDLRTSSELLSKMVHYATELALVLPGMAGATSKWFEDSGASARLESMSDLMESVYTLSKGVDEGLVSSSAVLEAIATDSYNAIFDRTKEINGNLLSLAEDTNATIDALAKDVDFSNLKSQLADYYSTIQQLKTTKSEIEADIGEGIGSPLDLSEINADLTRVTNKFKSALESIGKFTIDPNVILDSSKFDPSIQAIEKYSGAIDEVSYRLVAIDDEIKVILNSQGMMTEAGVSGSNKRIQALKSEASYLKDYQEMIGRFSVIAESVEIKTPTLSSKSLASINKDIAKLTMSAKDFANYNFEQKLAKYTAEAGGVPPVLEEWSAAMTKFINTDKSAVREATSSIEEFKDAYAKATMSDEDYEILKLDERLDTFDRYIKDKDKVKLEEWYNAEVKAIRQVSIDEESERLESLAADRARAYSSVVSDISSVRPELSFDLKFDALEAQATDYLTMGLAPDLVNQWHDQMEDSLEDEQMLSSSDFIGGFSVGLDKSLEDMQTWAEAGASMSDSLFSGMASSMTDFLMTGETSFSDFANAVISDLIEITLQQLVVNRLMSAFSDMFGGPSSISSGAGFMTPVGLRHTGGVIGTDAPTATRDMPKFHTGGIVGSDEQLAILKNGEGVFTEGQMKALGTGDSQGGTSVVVNNYSGEEATTKTSTDANGKKMIEVMVGQAMKKQFTSGSMDSTMRSNYGVSRSVR